MKVWEKLAQGPQDERVRRNVYPVRVVKTWGVVENAQVLLEKKTLQITTNEPRLTALKNDADATEEAGILLDFGAELHGAARLLTLMSQGHNPADVRLTFGESVMEACSSIGEKNATNDHAVRDMRVLLPKFSDQEFAETGFRFLCIRLMSPETTLLLKAVTAVFIYRDLPYLGSFCCSNPRLNEIYDTAAYTCHLSMQKYIWDGIKRDRLVWVGDMHPEMLTVRTVFGPCGVMEAAIRFARETTPLPGWMNGMPPYSLWWIHMLWDWYEYSGDEVFLAEHREYALALLQQIGDTVNADGTDTFPDKFLDWPTYGTPACEDGTRGLLVLALQAGEKLARHYGEPSLENACRQKYQAMQTVPANSHGAKQVAAMLSLAGMADPQAMADIILKDGAKGLSTFMSYYILKAAAVKSMPRALSLLEEYYGGMLDVGATSFWEDFNIEWLKNAGRIDEIVPGGMTDIHGDKGAACYVGFRHSLCHGWSSGPTAFLAEEVLGIHIDDIGCRRIRLQPDLGNLEWAEGTYPTPLGVLTVSCRRQADGTVKIEYQAPEGMEVILPAN